MEILNALTIKGHKKIGKDKIKELEKNPDRVDYDAVIEYYQAVLKKEREQIEEDKKEEAQRSRAVDQSRPRRREDCRREVRRWAWWYRNGAAPGLD